jgi:septal ring factor EnvC (AmiA/AmiB activator)
MTFRWAYLIILFWGLTLVAQTPSKRQQELESQRLRLKNEIKQINTLLFTNTKKRKDILTEVEDLTIKLNVREALIKVTNDQSNLLTRQIQVNERQITQQRKELQTLKEDYARLIQHSYISKSLQNRLMFLFSSESFLQAYKTVHSI